MKVEVKRDVPVVGKTVADLRSPLHLAARLDLELSLGRAIQVELESIRDARCYCLVGRQGKA
jgi:hypothetical protein